MSSQPPTQTMEDSGVSLELEMKSTPPPTDLQREEAIVELAHKITNRSESFNYELPFESAKGGCLDPKSGHFDARTWAQAFYNLRYGRSGGKAQARVAGVAFKDLSVWGKGSRTDFQSTVGNNMLKVPAFFGRGEQRIDILRNLDGLVLPGEQLCVLGPPGYDTCLYLMRWLTLYQLWMHNVSEDHCGRNPWVQSWTRDPSQLSRYHGGQDEDGVQGRSHLHSRGGRALPPSKCWRHPVLRCKG
jgi:hypothetical protein